MFRVEDKVVLGEKKGQGQTFKFLSEYNQFQQTNLINSSFEFSQCQEDDNCVAFITIEAKIAKKRP